MINGKSLIPVWEDTYYEYSGETLNFRLKMDGRNVFDGYAEGFPDGTPIRVYVNRIAVDYLSDDAFRPDVTGLTENTGAMANFELFQLTLSGGSYEEDVKLGDIYIYYGQEKISEGTAAEPINGHADSRMKLPMTAVLTEQDVIEID